jgi:hypothetical protein
MDASPKESNNNNASSSPVITISPVPNTTTNNNTKRLYHSHHAAELTPVTRNTSFCEDGTTTTGGDGGPFFARVSPADATGDLAMPSGSDFNTIKSSSATTTATLQQRRSLTMDARTLSVGTLMSSHHQRDQQLPPMAPVPLVARKFNSFNSRQQYNQQAHHHHRDTTTPHQPILTPYQPADRESFGVTPSQVSNIFIPRDCGGGPILLNERQWSIPSIRLANHLGGSTTTWTDEEDLGDDASWSSMGSSLYMPEEEEQPSSSSHPILIVEASSNLELNLDQLSTTASAAASSSLNSGGSSDRAILVPSSSNNQQQQHKQRTTHKHQRHASNKQNALDWLQNLQHDGLTEAASSKFLTKALLEYP